MHYCLSRSNIVQSALARCLPMQDLDLNLIPYLVAMEETRNVSRAAERLGVSQPRVKVGS